MTDADPARTAPVDGDEDHAEQVGAPAGDTEQTADQRRQARAPRNRQVPHAERNR